MMTSFNIPVAYNMQLLERGIKYYNSINFSSHPHLICVGATGSGKTYALALLLGKITYYQPHTRLVICDYKQSGFSWLNGRPGYYGYHSVLDGITTVYQEFCARLELNDERRNRQWIFLVVDEYSALVSSIDKKVADDIKRKIGEILMMGRSLGIHLIIGMQRADAAFFGNGVRDQFGAVLALGNLSREQKQMLFQDSKEAMTDTNACGQGYLLIDGQGLVRIQIPTVKDTPRLHTVIADHLFTPPAGAGEADAP